MRSLSVVPVALIAIVFTAGSATAQGNPLEHGLRGPADQRRFYEMRVFNEVHDALSQWREDWEEGDVRGLLRRYTDDAVLYPAAGGEVTGQRGIGEWFAGREVEDVEYATLSFETSGDLATVVERITYRASDGAPSEETTLIVLRRGWNGDWKIVSQLARPVDAGS